VPLTRRAAKSYGVDLAYVHDAGHGDVARRASRDVLRRLRARGLDRGLVVDLGCGSGIASEAFLRAGFDVLGVDVSRSMLAIARARCAFSGRRARFREGSFVDVPLPPCVAVVAFGEVLGYAFDRRSGAEAFAALAQRVRGALAPGGLFVFDVLGPGAVGPEPVRRGREGPDWRVAVTLTEAGAPPPSLGTLTRDIETTRRLPNGRERTTRERHVVRLFPPALVLEALAGAGLVARRVPGYGGEPFPPFLAAFVAERAKGASGRRGRSVR